MSGWALWQRQILTIVSLEWRKTLFSRRGLWVYFLAFLPALLFGMNAIRVKRVQAEMTQAGERNPNAVQVTGRIRDEMSATEVAEMLEKEGINMVRIQRGRREVIRYSDGQTNHELVFREGKLTDRRRRNAALLSDDIYAFAGTFQFFFIRLAIFFGCVGIFVNLFRGEMLDQSLHYYLLAPVRREVLVVAKYVSGLVATVGIFGTSAALQLYLMLSAHTGKEVSDYMAGPGWGHVFAYLGVTAMACVGYGSVFLAAGLLMKNPMIPAVVILTWEGANWFLPSVLKKISIIHYLQSLCPVVAQNADIPEPLKLLATTASPTPGPVAVAGILGLSTLILALASWQARKLEINYSSE